MNCDRERLSAYLDGELSFEEVRQLREHLASCERCSADLEAYRGIDQSLERLERTPPPSDLRRSVFGKLEARRQARARLGWVAPLLTPAVPLTAGFVLVAAAVAIWRTLPAGAAPLMTAAFTVQD